ncbi:hypothetical protein JHK87_042837 [Glycine soja]|nr:hypothetical protein JHK87_042837 [Glycine soja]
MQVSIFVQLFFPDCSCLPLFAKPKRVQKLELLWQELFTELRDKLQCGSLYLIQNLRIVENQSEYRLHDAIDKNLLLQGPLVVMLTLGKIKDATGVSGVDKYPLSVQNIKFGSKLYVNADITEIHEFRQSLSVPFYSGGIIHDKDGSQSQSSQSNVVENFLQNAQVVNIGEINNLRQDCYCLTVGTVDEIIIDAPWSYDSCPNCTTTFDPSKGGSACRSCHTSVIDTVPRYKLNVRMEHNGDKGNFLLWDATCIKLFGKTVGECRDELIAAGGDIKVFPTCVDEILSKTWAVIFKFRSQLRQSSMLDVSEELHHIQSLIATLGLKCISQCSPTINDNNIPATSFQSTPPSHRTLPMNDSEHCSKRHTVNVSSIQRNLMSSFDNKKNRTTASASTCQASNPYSNMIQSDIHRDEHQTPTNTTQDDQFVGDDNSDSTDNDVNMTQENINIEYSSNDPTIDDLDDYDEQTFLSASSAYQNTGIRLTEKETIHLCLTEIENMLQANRRSLRDFPSMSYPIGYAQN